MNNESSPNALTLYDSGQSITVIATEAMLITDLDDTLQDCVVTVSVTPDTYKNQIDPDDLFNLQADVRLEGHDYPFADDADIKIEVRLEKALLPDLQPYADGSVKTLRYLRQLSQSDPENPLVQVDNWYALSVVQSVPLPDGMEGSLKQGYRTRWAGGDAEPIEQFLTTTPILDALCHYLDSMDMDYERHHEKTHLRMTYQGDTHDWLSYAVVRETTFLCIIYSIIPVTVTDTQLNPMIEFIMRANFGLPVGNFEMDLNDGEMRFKTSLDLGGQSLTATLARQVVLGNYTMVERYLPGFEAVMRGVSPIEALALCE